MVEFIGTSINKYLDEDSLTGAFTYFSPTELLSGSMCCRLWRNISMKDKQLWESLCVRLWETVIVNHPDIENIDLLSRIKNMSLIQIKRSLLRVDVTRCIEKNDFQRMMLAKLLFKDKSAKDSTALRIYYPEWALKIGVFKATYFHNARDRKRTEILFGELVAIEWKFNFKNEEQANQAGVQTTSSRFKEDFTMISALGQNTFNWNVSVQSS